MGASATACMARPRRHGLGPRVVPDDDTYVGRVVLYVIRWVSYLSCGASLSHVGHLAYTMFNVYLPKLLETGSSDDTSTKSLEDSLWDVLIFTMGGCPGAIVCHPLFVY